MALGILGILFTVIGVASMGGLILLFTTKNKSVYTGIFVVMAILSVFVAYMNIVAGPSNYILRQVTGALWGGMAVAAIILQILLKKQPQNAKYLLAASLAFGVIQLFIL